MQLLGDRVDNRLMEAARELMRHKQGSSKERANVWGRLILDRIGEVGTSQVAMCNGLCMACWQTKGFMDVAVEHAWVMQSALFMQHRYRETSELLLVQLLNQAGRTSLDEDLQLLARHAAPMDRSFYAACQKVYLEVGGCTRLFCLIDY